MNVVENHSASGARYPREHPVVKGGQGRSGDGARSLGDLIVFALLGALIGGCVLVLGLIIAGVAGAVTP